MRYLIRLSYNGADFCGWQEQTNSPSVQESLQKAIAVLLKTDIPVTGAGRTDTSVNAINYVAHFDTEEMSASETAFLRYKLNAILPQGIVVHEVSPTGEEFHARFDATSREYKYFIHRKKDPFIESRSHFCTFPLDVEEMNKACSLLLGRKDFSCFEKAGGNNKTSICNLTLAEWKTYKPDHVEMLGFPYDEGDYLVFTIRADRFLRNMVRAVVGTMIEIGRGKHNAEWVSELLKSGNRSSAGQSVPGHALFLCQIDY